MRIRRENELSFDLIFVLELLISLTLRIFFFLKNGFTVPSHVYLNFMSLLHD